MQVLLQLQTQSGAARAYTGTWDTLVKVTVAMAYAGIGCMQ